MKIYGVIVERLNDDGTVTNETMHVVGDSVLSVARAVSEDLHGFDNKELIKVEYATTVCADYRGSNEKND